MEMKHSINALTVNEASHPTNLDHMQLDHSIQYLLPVVLPLFGSGTDLILLLNTHLVVVLVLLLVLVAVMLFKTAYSRIFLYDVILSRWLP